MAHVAPEKKEVVANLVRRLEGSPVIAIVNVHGIPGPQFQAMRSKLRGTAELTVAKNSLLRIALRGAAGTRGGIEGLADVIAGQTAVVTATVNPFRLFQQLEATKAPAPARGGEVAPEDIWVREGETPFKPGPIEAVRLSIERNIEFGGVIFRTLGGLFVGTTSPRQLMGPVAIAQLSGESAQAGWIALFTLMASISLNLGLLNLMPIPILDGGHILIMALEGIARRDFSAQVKEKMLLAGFVLILLLMVTVIYNDLTRITWIERLIPWRN